nr:ead/Ea22-like family protein [Escherichia coli]
MKQITLNMALAVDSISFDAVRVALNLVANMQRLEMTVRFFIQRLEQSGISEQRRQTVSEIDYQALREAAEAIKVVATPQKLLAFRMKVTPQVVLVLLDELEAKNKRITELEAREVQLPTRYDLRYGHPINADKRHVMIPKENGSWLCLIDLEHALRVAGIRIKGE